MTDKSDLRERSGSDVTHDEARQIAQRLINSHFRQEPHARISIPAPKKPLGLISAIGKRSEPSMTSPASDLLPCHPNDVCECGDYRHQHKNGTGRCIMPDDLTHGFQPCLKFVLSRQADGDRYVGSF